MTEKQEKQYELLTDFGYEYERTSKNGDIHMQKFEYVGDSQILSATATIKYDEPITP